MLSQCFILINKIDGNCQDSETRNLMPELEAALVEQETKRVALLELQRAKAATLAEAKKELEALKVIGCGVVRLQSVHRCCVALNFLYSH